MPKDLSIRIIGDASSFNRAVDQASGKANKLSSRFSSLAKGAGIGAAAGGVALLTKSLFDSVGKAKEAEKAQARLESALASANVSYGKHGDAIQGAIDKTSKLAAIDDEDLSDSFAKLVRTTGDVTKATEGMNLAADIARARNISLEAATKTVEKGLAGNEGAFRKVGVQIDKGTTATEAFEKAQAQFAGAAEKHGATAAGAQEKLSVAFENLQEKIGQKLLPVLAKLAVKLTEAITWAETNWPKFQKAAEPVFDAIKLVIDNFMDKLKAIGDVFLGVVKIIQGIKNGQWSTVWEGIKQVVVDGLGGIVTATLALPAKVLKALGQTAWDGLSAVGGWIKDKILAGLSGLANGVSNAIISAINAAIGLLNRAIDAYNSIPLLPNIGKVGTVSSGDSRPPSGLNAFPDKRAAGGPVTAGMPYIVGEGGRELFVPGESGRIIPNGAGGGGGVIENHVHVILDGRELFTSVQKSAVRDIRVGGRGVPGTASA